MSRARSQVLHGDAMQGVLRRHDGLELVLWTAGYTLVCALFMIGRVQTPPYDDSHFFKRISWNGIVHGELAWNLDDGPVHGATSQLYQLINLPIVALMPIYSMLAGRVFAVVCLGACFSILRWVTHPHDRGLSVTAACLAPAVFHTMLSGMQTALCLLVVSLSLLVAVHPPKHWVIAPLLVLSVYLTRPDAVLLVLPALFLLRPVTSPRNVFGQLAIVAALI